MLFQCDGALVKERIGVGGGEIAHGHGDPAEIFAGGAVFVHVTARTEGNPGGRCHEAVGKIMAEVDDVRVQRAVVHHLATAEAQAGAFVEGAIDHHRVAQTAGNGGGRVHKRTAGGAAAKLRAGEKFQLVAADLTQNFVFPVVVHAEGSHAINGAAVESGIIQRGLHRLAGQLHFTAAGILGKLRGTNADDGGFAGQCCGGSRLAHDALPPRPAGWASCTTATPLT